MLFIYGNELLYQGNVDLFFCPYQVRMCWNRKVDALQLSVLERGIMTNWTMQDLVLDNTTSLVSAQKVIITFKWMSSNFFVLSLLSQNIHGTPWKSTFFKGTSRKIQRLIFDPFSCFFSAFDNAIKKAVNSEP